MPIAVVCRPTRRVRPGCSACWRTGRLRRVRCGGDTGYTLVEFALTMVAFIALVMLLIQWALVLHARHVAQAAAEDAMRTSAGYQSSAGAGEDDGYAYLTQVAPRLLTGVHVAVDRSATTVNAEVTGSVTSIVPGFGFTVHETASGPVERTS